MSEIPSRIEKRLAELPMGTEPQSLYDPIRYILSLGGKRMRPRLVLLAYSLFLEGENDVLDQALAVELFHNFTLMHDDIMDDAPLRRGQPTVHEKWNSSVAILSGDTMMVYAYDLLLKTETRFLPNAIARFNHCAIKVCEGQQLDMLFENRNEVSEEEYINMICLKTAVLLGFCMEYGGILAGMGKSTQTVLHDTGVKAGIGFQLMDDLLDVYGDQEKFGKRTGGDIVSNKKTYLLIKALELANEKQRETLDYWLRQETFDEAEKVNAVKAVYDELGIRELTEQKMNSFYDQSFAMLDAMEARATGKQNLKNFFSNLMQRER